jgi:hypothetical protein
MDSPIDDTDTAAAKDDQVVQANLRDESTFAATRDMSLVSGDNEEQLTLRQQSEEEDSYYLWNHWTSGANIGLRVRVYPFDALHEACDKLPSQGNALVRELRDLVLLHTISRGKHTRLSLNCVDISQVSERRLRRLRRKLRFEKRISKDLDSIRARYKDLNDTLQASLDTYHDILATASHAVSPFHLEEATFALRYLVKATATLRMLVRGLLRTFDMTDSRAWDHIRRQSYMIHESSHGPIRWFQRSITPPPSPNN